MVSFGTQKSKSTSTPSDLTPWAFKNNAASTAAKLRAIYEPSGLSGVPDYTGSLATPMTADESSLLGSAVDKGTSNPFAAASNRLLGDTISGRYVDPSSNPFLEAYVRSMQRPTRQAFDEATLGDRATFTNAGQNINESSPYARARAIADRGLADSMGDIATKIGASVYDKERTLQAAAPGQASELLNSELKRNLDALNAASLPRLIQEQGIERGLDIYKQRLAALQNILGLATGSERATPAQTSTATSSGFNLGLLNLFGSGGSGASSGAG